MELLLDAVEKSRPAPEKIGHEVAHQLSALPELETAHGNLRRLRRLVRRRPRGLRADRLRREVTWMARKPRLEQPFWGITPNPFGVLPQTLLGYNP